MTDRFHLRLLALAPIMVAINAYASPYLVGQEDVRQKQSPTSDPSQNREHNKQQDTDQSSRARQSTKASRDRSSDNESPSLGILTAACPGKAVCVRGTLPYSPAHEAGIEPGDYILSVDGKEVTSPSALKKLISSMNPHAEVTLKVWRDGVEVDRKVQLASKADQVPKGHDAWLGVMLATDEKGGIKVDHIVPGSPASESELEEGDVLVKVQNEAIKDAQSFSEKIEEMGPGDELQLTVRRDGNESEVTVQLGSFGDAPMAFLRQFHQDHESSFSGGAGSTQLMDRALDDVRQQIRALRNEVRELKGDKGAKPSDSKKGDVSSLTRPSASKLVSQIQLQLPRLNIQRQGYNPGYNQGYYQGYNPYRSNYYGQYNQGYTPYYGNNSGYQNGNSYYYRYGGRPYYYGGNSNWYGNRPRAGVQLGPNGVFLY